MRLVFLQERPERLEMKKIQLRAEKRPASLPFFLFVVTFAGYPELYDFTNHSYHDMNRKQQSWRQISAKLEISGKLFSFI